MKNLLVIAVGLALNQSVTAADADYRKDVRPLWQAKCSACHGADAPYVGDFKAEKEKFTAAMKGPRMDTYADLLYFVTWPDTGALMRRLDNGKNASDGKAGNMYQYLGGTDADREKNLAVFKAWVGEDAWTLKRRDAISKDELMKIKAKY
jgi:hypothetical protein